MRILAVIKQVPDSRAIIKVLPDGSGIDLKGMKYGCIPFDEYAVEQAVQLKENRSDVEEVVVITAGPEIAVQTLHTALAFGIDRAVHISDETANTYDEIILAEILASAIKREEMGTFDLILSGKEAIDTDAGELAPALAEFLDIPHVGAVVNIDISDDKTSLRATRRIEGAEEVLDVALPAMITCEKGLVKPRHPSLPNLMKAKKKPVETLTLADLNMSKVSETGMVNCSSEFVKLLPPAERPECKMIEGEPEEMARELAHLLREEAKVV